MHTHGQWETPAAATQQQACALSRATEESHPGRRVWNDTDSLPPANGGTRTPAARASISIMCANTEAAVGRRQSAGYTTRPPAAAATICGCHSDPGRATQRRSEFGGGGQGGVEGGAATFKAFLVDDDGVVLWSLGQAEEFTSEWDTSRRDQTVEQLKETLAHTRTHWHDLRGAHYSPLLTFFTNCKC